LAIMKRRAIRNRSWFKVLTVEDRRFVDAVICTVTRIRSSTLLGLLEPLVRRLLEAIGGVRTLLGEVAYRMRTVGAVLALRISRLAQSWGNKDAGKWVQDEGFMRYLAIVDMNNIPIFRVGDTL